ncbi:uncharacterized protein LOC143889774 [Tasmannia lanceolata]|uniref:uncharacterized protein LOC143889774 n=1 Tax=Tasmannia lanceolata TaxID=3420 RepID=UPI004062BE4A
MAEGTRFNRLKDSIKTLQAFQTTQYTEASEFRKTTESQFLDITKTLKQFQELMENVDAKLNSLHQQGVGSERLNSHHSSPNGRDTLTLTNPVSMRPMRLDVPKFDGTDAAGWIFKAEQFFAFHNTPNDQRLLISSFHMEGHALSWFQWMYSNGFLKTWNGFLEALSARFGPSPYEDYKGALSKLLQTTTVLAYQAPFENLAHKVTGLSESFLLSFFISGLKPEIKRDLLIAKPQSLLQAMSLGRLQEDKFNDLRKTIQNPWFKHSAGPGLLPTPAPTIHKIVSSSGSPQLPVKKLTPNELKLRKEKGLSYNCDEKYIPGHKCK